MPRTRYGGPPIKGGYYCDGVWIPDPPPLNVTLSTEGTTPEEARLAREVVEACVHDYGGERGVEIALGILNTPPKVEEPAWVELPPWFLDVALATEKPAPPVVNVYPEIVVKVPEQAPPKVENVVNVEAPKVEVKPRVLVKVPKAEAPEPRDLVVKRDAEGRVERVEEVVPRSGE